MVITLIGSLKYEPEWHEASKHLTLAGHIVVSVAVFPSSQGEKNWYTPAQKTILDLVHLRKIEMANAVVLIHPDYIGESTAREILYATQLDKPIFDGAREGKGGWPELVRRLSFGESTQFQWAMARLGELG